MATARGRSSLFFGSDEEGFEDLLDRLKKDPSEDAAGGEDRPERALTGLLAALADVLERGTSEATWGQISEGLARTFGCSAATVYRLERDPGLRRVEDWRLRPVAGGRREVVTAKDGKLLPALREGKTLRYEAAVADKAIRQTIATAFSERRFLGLDVEPGGITFVTSEREDLGDGRISLYVLPLIFRQRRGRVAEKKVVGAVALEGVPVAYGVSGLVGPLETLLAHALLRPETSTVDGVTGLLTEDAFRVECGRWFAFAESIRRRSRSGAGIPVAFVFGFPDLLTSAYKMEAGADSLLLSDVKFGVGTVLLNLLAHYSVRYTDGSSEVLKWGFAGNLSEQLFGVGLPGVTKNGALEFARKAKEEVIRYPFLHEERLPLGEITVSQVVLEIGQDGWKSPDKMIEVAAAELSRWDKIQRERSGGGNLEGYLNVVAAYEEGSFKVLATGEKGP
ncbi:MAG: hypothetical protein L0216_16935 [Planctomycetales bacterium]|nr:hypothetical protein [Planctomycetales bacterium]